MTRKIRVLLVEDHAVVRSGLRMLIDAQTDMETAGEAATGMEAEQLVAKAQPDVVLMDLSLPGGGGIETTARIRKQWPDIRVVVLTMHDDPGYLRAALAAGAAGYVVKKAVASEVLSAIRAVAQGRSFIDFPYEGDLSPLSQRRGGARGTEEAGLPTLLSEREREVLTLVAHGHTNREIADQLSLSVKSVESYRARLNEKLGFRTRAELVRFALDCGLLTTGRPSGETEE